MAEEFDLLPFGAKSSVWSYFGFPAREGQFLEKSKNVIMLVIVIISIS